MKLLLVLFIALLVLQGFAAGNLIRDSEADGTERDEENLVKNYDFRNINCSHKCWRRCSKASRKKICHRACKSCCARCRCVPPGTFGNKNACPCYASLRTHGNRHKCP